VTFRQYYGSLPKAVRSGRHGYGDLKIILPGPVNFKFSLRDQKRMLSHLLFQTDKDQEWQIIQGLICEAFGLNRDLRLVLSVVDHEGDEILMYVQTNGFRSYD
jgi:hypothetical protein